MMNSQTQTLLEAVLALPEPDRAELAERLLETLSPDDQELTDDELAAELDRRRTELQQGRARTIPWSELKREE